MSLLNFFRGTPEVVPEVRIEPDVPEVVPEVRIQDPGVILELELEKIILKTPTSNIESPEVVVPKQISEKPIIKPLGRMQQQRQPDLDYLTSNVPLAYDNYQIPYAEINGFANDNLTDNFIANNCNFSYVQDFNDEYQVYSNIEKCIRPMKPIPLSEPNKINGVKLISRIGGILPMENECVIDRLIPLDSNSLFGPGNSVFDKFTMDYLTNAPNTDLNVFYIYKINDNICVLFIGKVIELNRMKITSEIITSIINTFYEDAEFLKEFNLSCNLTNLSIIDNFGLLNKNINYDELLSLIEDTESYYSKYNEYIKTSEDSIQTISYCNKLSEAFEKVSLTKTIDECIMFKKSSDIYITSIMFFNEDTDAYNIISNKDEDTHIYHLAKNNCINLPNITNCGTFNIMKDLYSKFVDFMEYAYFEDGDHFTHISNYVNKIHEHYKIIKLISKYYTISTNVKDRMKFTDIYDKILSISSVNSINLDMDKSQLKNNLPLILKNMGLEKKRYSDGIYWYGLVWKKDDNKDKLDISKQKDRMEFIKNIGSYQDYLDKEDKNK